MRKRNAIRCRDIGDEVSLIYIPMIFLLFCRLGGFVPPPVFSDIPLSHPLPFRIVHLPWFLSPPSCFISRAPPPRSSSSHSIPPSPSFLPLFQQPNPKPANYTHTTIRTILSASPILHVSFHTPDPEDPFPAVLPMLGFMGFYERGKNVGEFFGVYVPCCTVGGSGVCLWGCVPGAVLLG